MTATVHNVRDFADWLPPMLVKELRQGLRARVFVSTFVAVQAIMIVLLGLRVMGVRGGDYLPEYVDDYQWLAISATLLILLPLRGLTAISEETTQKTLDLMQLTSMTTARLVWGKWCALASQTLLLVVALLPYEVLTYFFGEVNVIANLQLLGWLVLASLVLTGLCIALSTANMFVRFVLLMIVAAPIVAFGWALMEEIGNGNGASSMFSNAPSASWILMFLFMAVMMTLFFMAVASARISHVAENASATIRCTVLFTMLGSVMGICLSESDQSKVWMMISLPMLMWAAMEAMTEHASLMPAIYMPWLKLGRIGQVLGRVLSPGWGTGILFVLLVTAVLELEVALILTQTEQWRNGGNLFMFHSMFQFGMTMLFPGTVLCLLPKVRQRHYLFIIMQLGGIGWFIACSAGNGSSGDRDVLAALLPPSAFLNWFPFSYHHNEDAGYVACITVDIMMLIWLLVRSQPEFETIRRGEAQARRMLRQAAAPLPAASPIALSSPPLP